LTKNGNLGLNFIISWRKWRFWIKNRIWQKKWKFWGLNFIIYWRKWRFWIKNKFRCQNVQDLDKNWILRSKIYHIFNKTSTGYNFANKNSKLLLKNYFFMFACPRLLLNNKSDSTLSGLNLNQPHSVQPNSSRIGKHFILSLSCTLASNAVERVLAFGWLPMDRRVASRKRYAW
jgi:hypothetical protein